jgi:hypothetical protein
MKDCIWRTIIKYGKNRKVIVNRKKNNTMVKRKRTKGLIYKAVNRNLKTATITPR